MTMLTGDIAAAAVDDDIIDVVGAGVCCVSVHVTFGARIVCAAVVTARARAAR